MMSPRQPAAREQQAAEAAASQRIHAVLWPREQPAPDPRDPDGTAQAPSRR